MKRITSLILALLMLFSIAPTAFAADFTDFNSSHWAYSYVNNLVSDGTINGFEDGSFRPEATVTRAQFVKMIGNGPETRDKAFDDVDSSHWAYGYIMTSGLDAAVDNLFMPDTAITRGEVATLLWKRAGSPKGITAPPVIHRQSRNYDAASWVYTNSIMTGDDNVNLRLGDTLTRAEASALIVRSREVSSATAKTYFIEAIDSSIAEKLYTGLKLVDKEYRADSKLTNGEVAMAAARLLSSDDKPSYPSVSAEITFEHQYAQPINMLSRYYLGLECDNAEYADKNATVADAIAALMFATSRSAGSYIALGTENYPSYVSKGNENYDKLLKNAYSNGIVFTTGDKMDLAKDVTSEEFAKLVLLFDGFSGFHRIVTITPKGASLTNAKLRADGASYPKNYTDYRVILADVPNYVYEAPFANALYAPKAEYSMTNTFKGIFTTMLSNWVGLLGNAGYELSVKYYPGVAVNDGNGYTMRVKIDFKNIPASSKLGDLINCTNANDGARLVNSGDSIYADIATGKMIDGINIGIEQMVLTGIIG